MGGKQRGLIYNLNLERSYAVLGVERNVDVPNETKRLLACCGERALQGEYVRDGNNRMQ